MAGDEDIELGCHALEQPQPGEVVRNRVGRVVEVEQRDQEIGNHVAGDEDPTLLNQERRMSRGVRCVFDEPDSRAIPGDLRRRDG